MRVDAESELTARQINCVRRNNRFQDHRSVTGIGNPSKWGVIDVKEAIGHIQSRQFCYFANGNPVEVDEGRYLKCPAANKNGGDSFLTLPVVR